LPPKYKIMDEVRSYTLLTEGNLFEGLLASVRFEDVGKGRQGAVLIKIDETYGIPIVRTSTRYSTPAQHFRSIHEQLAQQVQKSASLSVGFNNALIESYTNAHNSVIVFSVDTNRRLKHKIVLNTSTQSPENQWLGITFRMSKTFVCFRDECAYFQDDARLTLANDEQKREFYHLRRRENNETDFIYPRITYTISESDMMPPEPIENSRAPSQGAVRW
jgi:hypothetical protein